MLLDHSHAKQRIIAVFILNLNFPVYCHPSDLGELLADVETQPALPPKQSRHGGTSTPGGSIAIPRPPSRRGEVN